MWIVLLILTACAPKPAPAVFVTPIPEAAPPPELEDLAALLGADACTDAAPYIPGKPPPYVVAGVVTCRALVVPEADVVACLHDADLVAYWQQLAELGHAHREIDRLRCEDVAGQRWDYGQDLRGDLRRARIETTAGAAAGLLIGLAVGLAAAQLAP